MSEMTIEVHERTTRGKNSNRRLRAAGKVPAVVYGGGLDSTAIEVEQRKVETLMRSGGGENTVFLLKLAGTDKSRHTMIRELLTDPVNGKLIHIDFQRISMDEKVKVSVPVEPQGVPYGVKTENGMMDVVTREIEVECLPDQIPNTIILEVTELHVGQHIEAAALELPEGVVLHDEPTKVIVSIVGPQKEAVEEEEEDGELLTATAAEPAVVGQEGE